VTEQKHERLMEGDVWEEHVFKNQHECVNEWLRSKASTGKSRRTLNSYSRTLARFFHEFLPDTHPSEVTVGDIEAYLLELDDRDVAQNTKRRYLESLSAFYTWTLHRLRFEDFTGNPARVVLEDVPKERRARPETATWENGKRVVWHIDDPRDKTAAVLMAKTGARVREVVTLQWQDLDVEDGFIRFRDRKGGAETVNPVDDETINALHRVKVVTGNDTGYVFKGLHGGRIKRERVRRSVRRAAVDAGIMQGRGEKRWHHKFTPHYYRTIFTSLMRNNGMPDHFVRYLRGDSDEEVMDLYTRIPREQVREEYLNIIKPLNI